MEGSLSVLQGRERILLPSRWCLISLRGRSLGLAGPVEDASIIYRDGVPTECFVANVQDSASLSGSLIVNPSVRRNVTEDGRATYFVRLAGTDTQSVDSLLRRHLSDVTAIVRRDGSDEVELANYLAISATDTRGWAFLVAHGRWPKGVNRLVGAMEKATGPIIRVSARSSRRSSDPTPPVIRPVIRPVLRMTKRRRAMVDYMKYALALMIKSGRT